MRDSKKLMEFIKKSQNVKENYTITIDHHPICITNKENEDEYEYFHSSAWDILREM